MHRYSLVLGAAVVALAQSIAGLAQTSGACTIGGTIAAGAVPLPGVAVTLSTADGQAVEASSTAVDGTFTLRAPASGALTLKAELMAFATVEMPIVVDAGRCQQRIDVVMSLASRSRAAAPRSTGAATAIAASGQPPEVVPPHRTGAEPGVAARAREAPRTNARPGSFQSLELVPDQPSTSDDGQSDAAQALLPPGFTPDAATESVASIGSAQASGGATFFDRAGPFGDGGFGGPGGMPLGGGPGGRQVFVIGGPGGGLGGGGGRFGALGSRINRIRGSVFQSFDSSALDAPPFSLNGLPTTTPRYFQQRFGATLGGPLVIPKLVSSSKTFFFLNYTGNHASNPYDAYATVPTAAERSGDLSSSSRAIVDPRTGLPFAGGQIPASRIDPSARALLGLIPLPNQPGTRKNFHNQTTISTNLDDLNVRVIRTFGDAPQAGGGKPGMPGGFGGGRFGGGGGESLNVGLHYRRQDNNSASPFPALGGNSQLTAWDIPVGFTFTTHGLVNTLRGQFNRQRASTTNLFASTSDIAGQAGLSGVSADPFDWGAPALAFSSITGLSDVTPTLRINQTMGIGDQVIKSHGRHTVRIGADYRSIRLDSRSDPNARGSFVFTGLYTGLDFADFLLGLPQQSSVQFGAGLERFQQTSWDVYVQDDWRARDTVTVNAGIRYEYTSPFSESENRLATLDIANGFTAAVPVLAGGTGPYFGGFPDTIVTPDRNNVAPRIGVAWRPGATSVVRLGYGINYSTGVYQTIAQQLANQPPFAFTNSIVATRTDPAPLETALLQATTGATTNSYGVDPAFRTPSVQMWSVDLQRDFARTWSAGVGYTGTKGANLDLLRAPNRTPTGLRISGVAPFLWESSGADSVMNALTLRLRKRLSGGIAAGATYILSKSIDDASSIGGSATVVAQNDLDLAAERGLSSFDQRHRFSADLTVELPFGPDKRWLNDGVGAALLGGWVVNGNAQFASGTPFTARLLASAFDVSRGTNGTLRANYDGEPIDLANPTPESWFNTAAFSVPAPGAFGNAGRNTIIGPGTSNVNLGITRNLTLADNRVLSLQLMATNVFNTAQYSAIDTVVNSPTFGQVTAARAARRLQIVTRFRF